MSGVNDERALARIHRLARAGQVVYSRHARRRMEERGAEKEDVVRALCTASAAVWQSDRLCWRVEGGVDCSGDGLTMVVDIRDDVVVITVF
jgi:hypothetical protein